MVKTYKKKKTYKKQHIYKKKNTHKKQNTHKKKNTHKKQKIYKSSAYEGGGKTPYDRPSTPCKFGEDCTGTSVKHLKEYTHPPKTPRELTPFCPYGLTCTDQHKPFHLNTRFHAKYYDAIYKNVYIDEEQVITFIKDCYDEFIYNKMILNRKKIFTHLVNKDIGFLRRGINTELKMLQQTFFFHLIAYIICNLCNLIDEKQYEYGKEFIITLLTTFNEEAIDVNVPINAVEPELQACATTLGILYINCVVIISVLQDPDARINCG